MTDLDVAQAVPFMDLAAVNGRHRQVLDEAWQSVLAHGRFVGGPEVARFEAEFAAYCGATHAVGVANGTDALELIFEALGIGRGDEVIVPTNTFVATVEAVCAVGARPRFVDVLPDTLLIDPDAAEAAVTRQTAAVVAVHLYGQMVDPGPLSAMAARRGLALVEDAAQAHGATFAGRRAGSVGVAAAFSFYPGKNLGALGDGGAVVSSDAELVGRLRRIADHGRSSRDRHRHDVRGRNSRLDSLQGAVLSAKLASLDEANERRAALVARYRRRLPATVVPLAEHLLSRSAHHLGVVQVDDRPEVTRRLDRARIGWGVHYPVPCHLQPAFAEFSTVLFPVAEAAAGRILSLPLSPAMSDDQVDRVCAVLAEDTP